MYAEGVNLAFSLHKFISHIHLLGSLFFDELTKERISEFIYACLAYMFLVACCFWYLEFY